MVVLFLLFQKDSNSSLQVIMNEFYLFSYFEEHYEWDLWDTEFVLSFEKDRY